MGPPPKKNLKRVTVILPIRQKAKSRGKVGAKQYVTNTRGKPRLLNLLGSFEAICALFDPPVRSSCFYSLGMSR